MYKKFRLTEIGVAEIAIALFLIVLPCLENVDSCIKGTIAGVIWFAGTTLALGILISGKRRLVFSYPDIWVCAGFLLYGVYGWLGKHPVDTIILWNTLALCGTYLLAGNVSRWDVVILACFVAVIIQSIWGIGQQFNNTIKMEYIIAYILKNNNSGIKLLQKSQGEDSFKVLDVKEAIGDYIMPIECK